MPISCSARQRSDLTPRDDFFFQLFSSSASVKYFAESSRSVGEIDEVEFGEAGWMGNLTAATTTFVNVKNVKDDQMSVIKENFLCRRRFQHFDANRSELVHIWI